MELKQNEGLNIFRQMKRKQMTEKPSSSLGIFSSEVSSLFEVQDTFCVPQVSICTSCQHTALLQVLRRKENKQHSFLSFFLTMLFQIFLYVQWVFALQLHKVLSTKEILMARR